MRNDGLRADFDFDEQTRRIIDQGRKPVFVDSDDDLKSGAVQLRKRRQAPPKPIGPLMAGNDEADLGIIRRLHGLLRL